MQSNGQTIVIKVGTNSLVNNAKDPNGEILRYGVFENIGQQIKDLKERGTGVLLVSSGARASGVLATNSVREDSDTTEMLDRYSGIGWGLVSEAWRDVLGRNTASFLIGRSDVERRLDIVSSTLRHCIQSEGVVFVNETDASFGQVVYNDNDLLAAYLGVGLTQFCKVEALVLATTKNGILQDVDNPNSNIEVVSNLNQLEGLIVDHVPGNKSQGGMPSKLEAAQIMAHHGINTYITDASQHNSILSSLQGHAGTKILATALNK
jgi:glutamate 5-kinase